MFRQSNYIYPTLSQLNHLSFRKWYAGRECCFPQEWHFPNEGLGFDPALLSAWISEPNLLSDLNLRGVIEGPFWYTAGWSLSNIFEVDSVRLSAFRRCSHTSCTNWTVGRGAKSNFCSTCLSLIPATRWSRIWVPSWSPRLHRVGCTWTWRINPQT